MIKKKKSLEELYYELRRHCDELASSIQNPAPKEILLKQLQEGFLAVKVKVATIEDKIIHL